jgi:hypothetical protein
MYFVPAWTFIRDSDIADVEVPPGGGRAHMMPKPHRALGSWLNIDS